MRLPILSSAQPYAWQEAQRRWLRLQSALALAIFAVAGALLWFGHSLLAGFGVLAALLIGAALLLPALLDIVLHAGERSARGALGLWFWADSRQQISGLSLALMALLLALAVNVGVCTMVETFSRTFLVWLDGRLAADIYVSPADEAQARAVRDWLRERPEVRAVLAGGRAETQLGGAPVDILGLPDDPTYRDHWPLLQSTSDAWKRLRAGRCRLHQRAIVAAARTRASATTSTIPAPGGDWTIDIVGIYADYGNPKGQIAVNVAALSRRFPATPLTRMAVRTDPANIPALIKGLSDTFGLDGRNLMDQATVKRESRQIFNRTFAVTGALNAFTLGVAGIALLTSLLTLANSRLPQLAPLWAIGVTRRQLAAIELLKTLAVAAITALLALPLGLVGGLVPDRDRQREGVRLAAAVPCVSAAADQAGRGRDRGIAAGLAAAGPAAGPDAAGGPGQDLHH